MRKLLLLLGVVAVVVLGASVVAASIPDSQGVIHGCYKNSNGDLRVIDSAVATCPAGYTALNWSQTGPQGPPGEPANLTFQRIETQSSPVPPAPPPGNETTLIINCPPATNVFSGGWLHSNDDDLAILGSWPDEDASGWLVRVRNDGSSQTTFLGYALCVSST